MLGRLDEDLSCANSRLFRTTLYANREVADFMKANFILYWSSERPVPRLTIDYGDGRKVVTTTTGNSAHYILAADGQVVDVLPGIYAPRAFRAELAKSLAFATSVADLSPGQRDKVVRLHHQRAMTKSAEQLQALGEVSYAVSGYRGPGGDYMDAQRATASKAAVEVRQLKSFLASKTEALSETDLDAWSALAQRLWPGDGRVLDDASRALVTKLHMAGPIEANETQVEAMIARLERNLLADSALNQVRNRYLAHQLVSDHGTDFTTLNTIIYSRVFHTPARDLWMGLVPRTDFTGLPGDGVVMPEDRPTTAQR
jgi:hypothetical protein